MQENSPESRGMDECRGGQGQLGLQKPAPNSEEILTGETFG